MSGLRANVELPLRPEAAAAARRIVAGVLGAWRMSDLVPDTQLVVSELVGNAYQHAPGYDTVELELLNHDDGVEIRVNDGSALRPMLRAAGHDEATGRGCGSWRRSPRAGGSPTTKVASRCGRRSGRRPPGPIGRAEP